MGYLDELVKNDLLQKMCDNGQVLGKLRKARLSLYEPPITIEKNELSIYQEDGYELSPSRLKKQIKVKKPIDQSRVFENKCWCLMYDLGFRNLNRNDHFSLPYGKSKEESQQIDVVAINDDVAILIECKSSEVLADSDTDHRPYIDTLEKKIAGFKRSIEELCGGPRRVKFVFATNNQTLGKTNIDILKKSRVFHLDNSGYDYLNNLILTYKASAHYQFMGMAFKGEIIKQEKIRIPAIKGTMGGNTYYMFSIEPEKLLRISFVLHRVRANVEDFPTYQRLLKTNRIKSLSSYINEGGYFPNSIIINFETRGEKKNRQLEWEDAGQRDDSISDHGILKIPNTFAIAYVIDGQHRLYGYSFSDSHHKFSQTIPVVAFVDLEKEEQLQMFLDINENQKPISANLKSTLYEDILWSSPKNSKKMLALMSSINNLMGTERGSLISKYLSIGEDNSEISMTTIMSGIKDSGFLPKVEKEEMIDSEGVLFRVGANDQAGEMNRIKLYLAEFLCLSFDYVITNFEEVWMVKGGLIRSVRGAYAYIRTLGELNVFLTKKGVLNKKSSVEERFEKIKKYINTLFKGLVEVQKNDDELRRVKSAYGASNKKIWNNLFTGIINKGFKDFTTPDYVLFLETQDQEIQNKANKLIDKIEEIVKERTVSYAEVRWGEKWGYDNFYDLYSKLREDAEQKQKQLESMGVNQEVEWTSRFNILDYLTIWKEGWGVELKEEGVKRLSEVLSINMDVISKDGEVEYYRSGKEPSYKKGEAWLKKFTNIRNDSKHKGSRGIGINSVELQTLERIYNGLTRV